jgi:hypothetical protein
MIGIFLILRRELIEKIPAGLIERRSRAHSKEILAKPDGFGKVT